MAEIKSIKAYETNKDGQSVKSLVVDDGTYKVIVPVVETKIDVDAAVERNKKITAANDKYIQACVNKLMGKTSSTKEIDAKNLYTTKAVKE